MKIIPLKAKIVALIQDFVAHTCLLRFNTQYVHWGYVQCRNILEYCYGLVQLGPENFGSPKDCNLRAYNTSPQEANFNIWLSFFQCISLQSSWNKQNFNKLDFDSANGVYHQWTYCVLRFEQWIVVKFGKKNCCENRTLVHFFQVLYVGHNIND